MDREKCRMISEAALKALKAIEAQFKIKVSPARGTFGSSNCVLKFEFAEVDASGVAKTRKADNWMYAVMLGLPKDGLGKEFMFRKHIFKVTGFRPRAKYSIVAARQPDGKEFCFQPRQAFSGYVEGFGANVMDDEADVEKAMAEAEGQD